MSRIGAKGKQSPKLAQWPTKVFAGTVLLTEGCGIAAAASLKKTTRDHQKKGSAFFCEQGSYPSKAALGVERPQCAFAGKRRATRRLSRRGGSGLLAEVGIRAEARLRPRGRRRRRRPWRRKGAETRYIAKEATRSSEAGFRSTKARDRQRRVGPAGVLKRRRIHFDVHPVRLRSPLTRKVLPIEAHRPAERTIFGEKRKKTRERRGTLESEKGTSAWRECLGSGPPECGKG